MKRLLVLLLCLLSLHAGAEALPAQGSVEVVFSPGGDAEGAIVRSLLDARKSVDVQAYVFTSRPLAHALLAAWQRGVQVRVLADREMTEETENSQIPVLAQAGIPVWLETRYAAAHNKIILIDALEAEPTVITGSFNYTYSAQARNAENLLILRGNPELARRYAANWQRHRAEATAYGSPAHAF